MTLPTISVHLDHTERCEVRTRLAARLARRHRSHLMDIVPTGVPEDRAQEPSCAGSEGAAGVLVIVGQVDEAAAVGDAERRLPEDVMLEAGRPVLIVPRTGHIAAGLDRVLVAWDGSREASLSLHRAMPLLRMSR